MQGIWDVIATQIPDNIPIGSHLVQYKHASITGAIFFFSDITKIYINGILFLRSSAALVWWANQLTCAEAGVVPPDA